MTANPCHNCTVKSVDRKNVTASQLRSSSSAKASIEKVSSLFEIERSEETLQKTLDATNSSCASFFSNDWHSPLCGYLCNLSCRADACISIRSVQTTERMPGEPFR